MLSTLRARCCGVFALVALALCSSSPAQAEVSLPNIFGSHMVLQRDQANRVWGKAAPNESVTVTIGDQSHSTQAAADGKWQVTLAALPVGGPHTLTVKGATNTLTLEDVLVGEVWICAGQSNMQWSIDVSRDADLERAAARFPKIRIVTVPNVGTQEPQWNFEGRWEVSSPQTIGGFSAVGYFFGRQLHKTLDVPVGLINVAWGGSACEAWVRRDLLEANELYKPLLEMWSGREADYPRLLEEWKVAAKKAKDEGKNPPGHPDWIMKGNHRPANIYNGVLKPVLGYGIRGAIWYQGESNASRAYQYRELFPLMIQSWRNEWGQGDFPFYWVQLADFLAEQPNPGESNWAELREAQTMTTKRLPNVGQAVIIDIGEGRDIHPQNKLDVGKRLARLALTDVYQVKGISARSPTYESMQVEGNKVLLTFTNVDNGWRPFDVNEPRGFAIAGADKKWVWAKGEFVGSNQIRVYADEVAEPVAVRYAWADNPVCNVFSATGLPLTPFRTDDWPGLTINNQK